MKFLLLALIAVPCLAQVQLTLAGGKVDPGASATLNLSIASTTKPAAVQFTLTYPVALIASVSVSAGPAATAAGKAVYCSGTAGTTTCIIAGVNQTLIADGVLAIVTATTMAAFGSATITTTGALSAAADGTALATTGNTATLAVFSKFDLNSDGKVDILDLQQLINAILSQSASAVDLNGDSKFDVLDVQILAKNAK